MSVWPARLRKEPEPYAGLGGLSKTAHLHLAAPVEVLDFPQAARHRTRHCLHDVTGLAYHIEQAIALLAPLHRRRRRLVLVLGRSIPFHRVLRWTRLTHRRRVAQR